MLRLFAALPAVTAPRALADGSSGTLGAGAVGAFELRQGAVAPVHLADLDGARVLGRAPGASGPVETLDGAALRAVIDADAGVLARAGFAEAEASSPAAAVHAIRTEGWETPGDGGGALYARTLSEPAHPGRLQTADGAWWELAEPILRPEMFGAAKDGATDDADALIAAFVCASATGRVLELTGAYATYSDIELDAAVTLRGTRQGSRLVLFSGATLRFIKDGGASSTSFGVLENVVFEDGANISAWIDAPLVEIGRGWGWRIESCTFDGSVRRRHGLWAGRGNTIWASSFTANRFTACGIGVVIGDLNDATHNAFTANTCDHNRVCGAIFCNPHGGVIASNSFEHNEGKTGLAVLSQANGSGSKAVGVTITGNYIYNNATSHSGDADTTGLIIGLDVPDSAFTSGGGAWSTEVARNYIVSPHCHRAVRMNAVQGGAIHHNVVTRAGGSGHDIELSGHTTLTDVLLNKNQSFAEFDKVTSTGPFRRPAAELDGALEIDGRVVAATSVESEGGRFAFRTSDAAGSDDRGGMAFAGAASGVASVPGELVSLDDVAGGDAALVLAAVQRPDGTAQASFVVHLARGVSGPVAPISASGDADGAAFAVSGGVLSLSRNGAWTANCTLLFAGHGAAV